MHLCFSSWHLLMLASSVYSYTNQSYHVYRWVLLEVLDKVSPGSVNWKQATKPPIKMPFRKVENCNQVVKIGMQLKLSLVNVAGNDFVQGNMKLILGKSCIKTQDSSCLFYALYKFVKVMEVLCCESTLSDHMLYFTFNQALRLSAHKPSKRSQTTKYLS